MFPAEYKIRDLTIRPAAVLAPMAGVTDTLFRRHKPHRHHRQVTVLRED